MLNSRIICSNVWGEIMPANKVLIDSGFLYVLYQEKDEKHKVVGLIAESYKRRLVIPYVVLTETAYLFRRTGKARAVVKFLDALLRANYHYEAVLPEDLQRARDIMAEYEDAQFDFVDCCLMALSERLNINQICTLDSDFLIFRPKHVEFLEILP
jgi:uncharacterized protein